MTWPRRMVARALARDLPAFVAPDAWVARAAGLDLEAAGLRLVATPRHASVLVLVGDIPGGLAGAAAVAYAQMPRPRAILALGAEQPGLLPPPDVSVQLEQEALQTGVERLRSLLAASAWSPDPPLFSAVLPEGDAGTGSEHSHAAMNHAAMNHAAMNHAAMGHAGMDHSGMNHAAMGHGAEPHTRMSHGPGADAGQPAMEPSGAGAGNQDGAMTDHSAHGSATPAMDHGHVGHVSGAMSEQTGHGMAESAVGREEPGSRPDETPNIGHGDHDAHHGPTMAPGPAMAHMEHGSATDPEATVSESDTLSSTSPDTPSSMHDGHADHGDHAATSTHHGHAGHGDHSADPAPPDMGTADRNPSMMHHNHSSMGHAAPRGHGAHAHPQPNPDPGPEPGDHAAMNHETMDHAAMNHETMDHAAMGHGGGDHQAMDHEGMNHAAMDHGAMSHAPMDHSAMGHGSMDHAAMSHGAMDHAAMGHGGMDHSMMHGAGGFMSMVAMTKDLPRSLDGLPMEWIEVPFGPLFPGLPGGLALTLTLDGDAVARAAVKPGALQRELDKTWPGPAATFPARLARIDPLSPVAYRILAERALEAAAGVALDPGTVRGRVGALERERAANHLGWLTEFGSLLGNAWLVRRAATAHLALVRARGIDEVARLRPGILRFLQTAERAPLLQRRLSDIGDLRSAPTDAMLGPTARSVGIAVDERNTEAIYRAFKSTTVVQETGDALARFRIRLAEIAQSLDLILAAGTLTAVQAPLPVGLTGMGTAVIETPRGRASLHLELSGGMVTAAHLDTPSSHHLALVPLVAEGAEVADALVGIASLDLSPWESDR